MIKTFIKNFKFLRRKRISLRLKISNSQQGQSLIEILIALAIGAILIGAATLGIAFMIRSTATNQRLQVASGFARDMIEKLRSWSASDWQNIYLLEKGTSTKYFLIPSSTAFAVVFGEEGMLENDVRVGLVGKWGFDEATGTIAYDIAGSGNDGMFMNNPTRATFTQCKIGNCLSFDGSNDDITIRDATNLNFGTTDFSVSGWLYIRSNQIIPNQEYGFVNKNTTYQSSAGWGIELSSWGKTSPFPTLNLSGYNTGQTAWCNTCVQKNDGITTNAWHHVSFVRSGLYFYLYIDGILSASNNHANVATNVNNIQPIIIGDHSWGPNFPGFIDDVRVYNRALSATEIKNLYESKIFTRYFTIQNTCRKTEQVNGEVNIIPASSTSCDLGYFEDPSTQQASVFIQWPAVGNIAELKLVEYITRWRNEVLHEKNWSGGGTQEGPITSPNGKFASSTNIDIDSYGVIKVRPE